MSNRLYIVPTKFENIQEPDEDSVSWGYIIYNDYWQNYNNTHTEAEAREPDPIKFLKMAYEDRWAEDFFDCICENEKSVQVGDYCIEWEEVSKVIEESDAQQLEEGGRWINNLPV